MSTTRGAGVRPAGAPMVPMTPMPPPAQGGRAGGDAGNGALGAHAQEIAGAARRATTEVRREVTREMDRRSTVGGERAAETAGDMRRLARIMRDEGRDGPAQIVEGAAGRVDRLAVYLSSADTNRMMRDAQAVARRRPALVVGGAVILGLAVGRLVKAAEAGEPARRRTEVPS